MARRRLAGGRFGSSASHRCAVATANRLQLLSPTAGPNRTHTAAARRVAERWRTAVSAAARVALRPRQLAPPAEGLSAVEGAAAATADAVEAADMSPYHRLSPAIAIARDRARCRAVSGNTCDPLRSTSISSPPPVTLPNALPPAPPDAPEPAPAPPSVARLPPAAASKSRSATHCYGSGRRCRAALAPTGGPGSPGGPQSVSKSMADGARCCSFRSACFSSIVISRFLRITGCAAGRSSASGLRGR